MTFVVKQSEIEAAIATAPAAFHANLLRRFPESVKQHALDLAAHADHMGNVDRDAKAAAAEKRPTTYQAYPAPDPPALIDQAVARVQEKGKTVFVPDFKVINDLPSPEQVKAKALRAAKDQLIGAVSEAESAAANAVLPFGKRRANDMRRIDIHAADQARRAELAAQLDGLAPSDPTRHAKVAALADAVKAGRPKADADFVAAHEARVAKLDKIFRHAAALQSEIEDLTADNVADWKPRPFPT